MLCEVPLTDEQRDYATEHHALVYKFLKDNHLTTQQSDILTDKEQESYGRNAYLPSNDDLKISTDKIEDHIKSLHTRLIRRLVQHFNQKYHVSVDASEIDPHLLPEKPSGAWRYSKEKNQ